MITCHPHVAAASTSPDWWVLLSGLVASLITAGTVYGVFLLTRRTERKRASAERTAASVTRVIEAVNSFVLRATTYDQLRDNVFNAQKDFTHALIVFGAREIGEHREVANWAIAQAQTFSLHVRPLLEEKDDVQFNSTLEEMKLGQYGGRIAAVLLRWLRDGTDKPFDPELPEGLTKF